MNDVVFVNSHRYGSHTRKSPRAGSKREEAALKRNYRRTGFLNKLASDINRVVAIESDGHKLQKRFRKEPEGVIEGSVAGI